MEKNGLKIAWSFLYLVFGGLVFILGLNLLKFIPEKFQDFYKLGLPVFFLLLFLAARKYFPTQKNIFLAFFLVSIGWVLDFYLTGKIVDGLSINKKELSGLAVTMVISAFFVTVPVILGWWWMGNGLASLYLRGSEKRWGIIVGLGGLVILGGLGVLQAWGQGLAFKVLGAALPLTLVFSLANAFREELVYRAVFLESFRANIGYLAAVIVTTLVFAGAHVEVSYNPASLVIFSIILLLIGVVGSLIMFKTGSLIGAVLFHAGADVLLIMGMLASQQLILK